MRALAIFLKELVDALRDARTLFSSLAYVFAGPLALFVVVSAVAATLHEDALKPVTLCGKGEAPALVAHLNASGLAFADDGAICLDIPEDYGRRIAEGRPVRIGVLADLSTAGPTVLRLEREIRTYSTRLGAQRLIARGVAPTVTTPIMLDVQNRSAVSRAADVMGRVIILLFVCAPFFVSFAMAADTTAGERERRSLEPLLANPVGAFEIVAGKFLAVAAIACMGTAACIIGGLALLDHSSLPELGLRLKTSAQTMVHATILLLPLCLLVSAIQLAIGLWAKSFKDAQSYMMLFSFAPMFVGFLLMGDRLAQASAWPLAWELGALSRPLLGAAAPQTSLVLMAGIEIALCLAILAVSGLRLRSERMLSQA